MKKQFHDSGSATGMAGPERMPMIADSSMTPRQREAAEALIAGPRGAVFGPFVPLLRSPELMDRMQRVGEILRFGTVLEAGWSEFVMLIVSRQWTQQFEWCMHYPLAIKAGVAQTVLDQLAQGARPDGMTAAQATLYDFCDELARTRGVSDGTYARALALCGEQGVVELTALIGYFSTVSMIMNVARTPPMANRTAATLAAFPL